MSRSKQPFLRFHCFTQLRIIIILPIFLVLTSPLFAQSQPADRFNWKLDKTMNNVDFFYSLIDCNAKKVVLIKLHNKNDFKVVVEWKELFVTRQIKSKSEGFAGDKRIEMPKGEIQAVGCAEKQHKQLIVFPIQANPAYDADIEKFEFTGIKVIPAQ